LDIDTQKIELLEIERLNAAWRDQELAVIADHLMALEERDAGVEAQDLLPGSRFLWLTYRSAAVTGAVQTKAGLNDQFDCFLSDRYRLPAKIAFWVFFGRYEK
jgi:hypothetical protein